MDVVLQAAQTMDVKTFGHSTTSHRHVTHRQKKRISRGANLISNLKFSAPSFHKRVTI